MRKTLLERFNSKYIPEPNSGCWLWIGGEHKFGYGVMGDENHKSTAAHRISYRLFNGEITDGLCVLHRCDVPQCVNPAHLFLGTKKDNTRDAMKKGRLVKPPDNHSWKTHCKNGHLFDGYNLIKKSSSRGCRICTNINWNKRYHLNKRNEMRNSIEKKPTTND